MALIKSCLAGNGNINFDAIASAGGTFNTPVTISDAEIGATYIIGGAFTSALASVTVTGGTLVEGGNNATTISGAGSVTYYSGCVIVKATATTITLGTNGYAAYTKVS